MNIIRFLRREFGFYNESDLYKTFRIYLLLASVFAAVISFIPYSESEIKNFWMDLFIPVIFFSAFLFSFFSEWFRKEIKLIFFIICYLCSIYSYLNIYTSNYNVEDFVGFLLVFISVTIGIMDHRYSIFYSISFFLISLFGIINDAGGDIDPKIVSVMIFIIGVVGFIIHYNKYVLIRNLQDNRDELTGSRDRLLTVLESIDKVVYNVSIDEKGVKTLRYVSRKIEDILGLSIDEYITDIKSGRIIERIHPDDLPKIIEASKILSEKKEPVSMIYRFLKTDGYIWVEEKVFPKFNSDGKHIASIGISSDVTLTVNSETALKRSEERYRNMIERNLAGFYRMNMDGVVFTCNDSFAQIMGYSSKDDIIGKPIHSIYEDSSDKNSFIRLLKDRTTVLNHESAIVLKSGKKVWLLENVSLIRNSLNEPEYIEGTAFDISELKEAELKIRSAEENLRLVIDNIDSLVYSIDFKDGKKIFNFIGPQIEKLIGVSREQYIEDVQSGKINEFFHPDDLPIVIEKIKKIRENRTHGVFTYRFFVRSENQYRWLEEAMFPQFNSDGSWIRNFGVVRDISDRKLYEDTLKASELNYRTLFERNLAGVFRTTLDGRLLECNDAFVRIFKYSSKEEILSVNSHEFYFDPVDREKYINDLKNEGSLTNYELSYKRKDGTKVIALSNVTFFEEEEMLIGTLIDITDLKSAEEKILRSKQAYEQLVEGSPYGIFIHTDGKVLYANNAAFDIIGLNKETFVPDKYSMYDFLLSEYVEESIDRRKKIMRGEDVPFIRIKVKNIYGDIIDVESKSQLIMHEGIPSIQTTIKNISAELLLEKEKLRAEIAEQTNQLLEEEIREHKATQIKLIQAQQYAQSIIESSIDMIMASDVTDRITQVNTAALNAFGYTMEEMRQKTPDLLYADIEEFEKVRSALTSSGTFSGEIRNRRKNGEVFISYISASIIRDPNGDIIGSMGVSRDITEIIEAERIVKEQNAKIKSIFENTSNMMMWTIDRNYCFTSFNKNFQDIMELRFNIPVGLGKNLLEALNVSSFDKGFTDVIDAFERSFSGTPQELEGHLFDPTGQRWFETFLNPIYLDSGEIEEISCVAHDITEKKDAENDLVDSLKEKEVLLKEVHHRVKNNLQVISSILNLQSSYVKDEGTLQILRESQNRIKSMSFIHESLYQTKNFSSVNFSEYIYNLSKNLVHSYQVYSDLVDLKLDLGDIHLNLDQSIPCGLIVNELVSNALKYAFHAGHPGQINITLSEDQHKVSLRVEDNGRGLPEGFDHNNTETLGLQLVATLVEQLDGSLVLESAVGSGTKYLITFDKQN